MHRNLLILALLPMLGCFPNTRAQEDSRPPADSDADSDTDSDTALPDADGDGYSEADGDCDDTDDAVHPGAMEVCENGIDDNCDGGAGACALTSRSLAEADAKFTGKASGEAAGFSVSTAGDVNGDGFDDGLLGAPYNTDGGPGAGAAYLVLGSAAPTSRSLRAADAQFTGESTANYAGLSVSTAGDVNGDGFDDVLVGASHANGARGMACLLLGSTSPTSRSLAEADVDFKGEAVEDYAGTGVSTAGDVNGDGFDDVLVGALRAVSGSNIGAAYIMLGSASPTSRPLAAADAQFLAEAADDYVGYGMSNAGDVDGDGFDDVLVGAWGNDNGGDRAGSAYLVLGSALLASHNLGAADAQFTGEAAGDQAGYTVSTSGDVNGDGFDDVLVGAASNDAGGEYAGAAYLLLGSVAPTSRSLRAADAKFTGAPEDQAGSSVSTAGDLNDDGFDDVLVGAKGATDGGYRAGAAYILLGSASPSSSFLDEADVKLTAEAEGDQAGLSVATAGDMDGDGYGDVLLGANENDAGGQDAGAAYLLFGSGM